MLFHTTWEFHPGNSEEAIQRNLAFFSQWNVLPWFGSRSGGRR